MKKKNKDKEINLLELIPSRKIDHKLEEEDIVVLLAPRFKNRLLLKYFQPRLKNPFLKIKLDEIGSTAWLLCDGEHCVADIAETLKEDFGEKIEPCVGRLELFLAHLEGSGYIEFTNVEECRKNKQIEE